MIDSAELKTVQLELTNEKANGLMYQELAQTTEQALEELRRSTDEYSAKTQQELATREVCGITPVPLRQYSMLSG